jgi:phospholipase/carboxylesterase
MMALATGLAGAVSPRGIVGFSGLLALPEATGPDAVTATSVLLVHGTEDELLPAGLTIAAATRLAALGCPVEWHLRPGLGHGIDPGGLDMAADYLAKLFPP